MRLVDADTLYKFHVSSYDGEDLSEFSKGWNCCIKHLTQYTDTIDAAPVVHARWNRVYEDWRHQMAGNECSACGFVLYGPVGHYCPRCGAKMDGGTP